MRHITSHTHTCNFKLCLQVYIHCLCTCMLYYLSSVIVNKIQLSNISYRQYVLLRMLSMFGTCSRSSFCSSSLRATLRSSRGQANSSEVVCSRMRPSTVLSASCTACRRKSANTALSLCIWSKIYSTWHSQGVRYIVLH